MPIVSNFTDPQDTKQPKKNPFVDEFHTFKHLNIIDHVL